MEVIKVTEKESGQRLDKYLLKYLDKAPKSFIFKMLRKKNIKVNGKKAEGNLIINNGDIINLYLAEDTIKTFSQMQRVYESPITFKNIYEDDNILICDKPVGLLSQKESKTSHSLVEEIITYLISTKAYDPNVDKGFTPAICNRLDRNTSGIIVAGKNIKALQSLNELFREKRITKLYLTIVKGRLKGKLHLKNYITKDSFANKVIITDKPKEKTSKLIETIIEPIDYKGDLTIVEVSLITGKSHQIRAHLSHMGHPILGDTKYGDLQLNHILKKQFGLNHQLLHAKHIKFSQTNEFLSYLQGKTFTSAEDELFKRIYNQLPKSSII